ncbi:MAG: hypothetical protein ACOYMN_25425, partial [Roseimicrobium sp.]
MSNIQAEGVHWAITAPAREAAAGDHWLRRVIFGGFLVSSGFLVEGAGAARYYAAAVVMSVLSGILAMVVLGLSDGRGRQQPGTLMFPHGLQVGIGIFALIWVVRMVFDFRELGLQGFGLKIATGYMTHVCIVSLLVWKRYFHRPTEAVVAIVVAVAIYGAANLAADRLGFGTRGVDEMEKYSSRFSYASFRWLPPLAISNGSFSMLFAFAICVGIRCFGFVREPSHLGKCLLILCVLPVLVWCSIKVQFRGALIVASTGLVWAALSWRWRQRLDLALLTTFPLVALSFINLMGAELIQKITPPWVIEASGSPLELFCSFS